MQPRKRSLEKMLAEWLRDGEGRRQAHRAGIRLAVRLEVGPNLVDARIVDLSNSGFRLIAEAPIGDQRPTRMIRDGESLEIETRWVDGKQLGGMFIQGPALEER